MVAKQKKETTNRHFIAREAIVFIIIGLLASVITYYYLGAWFGVPITITVLVVLFFRNPKRHIVISEGLVVAPADGRVMMVEEVFEARYLKATAIRITIFMSLFNVHVNRIPISGLVERVEHQAGDYIPAYRPEAPEKNVACYTLVNTKWGKVLITQITGAVARRLVCYAHPGRQYTTGDLFGLIQFGSCVQLYLPPDVKLTITQGDKVRGGETEIGRF